MLSVLLTTLLFSGCSIFPCLISPVSGHINCTSLLKGCWGNAPTWLNSSAILDQICRIQSQRRSCYDGIKQQCKDLNFEGALNMYDYCCKESNKQAMGAFIDGCTNPKSAIIRAKHATCPKIRSNSTCVDYAHVIHCATKGVVDCCPQACVFQYNSLKLLYGPQMAAKGCPKTEYYTCRTTPTDSCVMPS